MSHPRWVPLIAVVVGIVVAASLTTSAYLSVAAPPGSVALKGVALNISYSPGSRQIWGPSEQDACLQSFPPGWPPPPPGPNCPRNLSGGVTYSFTIFEVWPPLNISVVYINASLSSPIPFQTFFCGYSSPLPPAVYRENLSDFSIAGGEGCGWGVVLTVPNPAPAFPTGFWMNATMTVHAVNSTTYA